MRYSYLREYTETDKFLDDLFAEDCSFEWCSEVQPAETQCTGNSGPEDAYIASLSKEMSEKLSQILTASSSLSCDRDRSGQLTKEELISRLIGVSNTLDCIINEIEAESTANNMNNVAIIGGDIALGSIPSMF